MYNLEELPNNVLCFTILDLMEPVVLTVPRLDMLDMLLIFSLDMLDTLDMFLVTGVLCLSLSLISLWSALVTGPWSLITVLSPLQHGISLTVLLRHRE